MVLFIFRFGEVIQVDLPEISRVPRPRPRRGASLGPSCTSRCGSPLTPPAWPPSPTPWPTAPCSSSSSPSSEQVRFSPFNKLCYLTHVLSGFLIIAGVGMFCCCIQMSWNVQWYLDCVDILQNTLRLLNIARNMNKLRDLKRSLRIM